MSIVTVDFETYYAKDFSLSKMTTEEYINDPRFQVIGMGIQYNDAKPEWFVAGTEEFTAAIDKLRSEALDHAILCHNTMFDGAILSWKYGIVPGMYFDTLCMARAVHGVDAGGSLKALAERYNIGEKGNEVLNALGKRLGDFSIDDLNNYGAYCRNDVALTNRLFGCLSDGFPDDEFQLIDMTLRMYTAPRLRLDSELLHTRLEDLKTSKAALLSSLKDKLNCATEEEVRAKLASNKQFADILTGLGVKVPTKISPATGKKTLALAKTDQGFIKLSEHDNPLVQELCAVRLGTKSTLEESRVERFIGVGKRNRGRLPVPLKYYGAHTGRWSGLDSVNFQNLPSRDKAKATLKKAVVAQDGYYIVNCDSSQIEARVLAWLAGQDEVVKAFAEKRDIYCEDATKAFGRTITKADEMERFIGKTMRLGLGYGTGAKKLHQTLTLGGAVITEDKCAELVEKWRENNDKIVQLWEDADKAIDALLAWPVDDDGDAGKPIHLGNNSLLVDPTGVRLPNGLYIRYPNLRKDDKGDKGEKKEKSRTIYDSRKGPVNLWGGVVVENVVQALARIIIGEQMIALNEGGYPPVLTVHDAAVCLVPENKLKEGLQFIVQTMSTAPAWGKDLPIACEAKYGQSYGELRS
jgi:DNA polymerase I-like protein with 3'-5' exonuclease and polymerase domains